MGRKAGGEGVATHQMRRHFKWIVLVTNTHSSGVVLLEIGSLTSRPFYAPGLTYRFFVCVGGENSTALFSHPHTKEKRAVWLCETMKQVLVFTYYIQLMYKSKLTSYYGSLCNDRYHDFSPLNNPCN